MRRITTIILKKKESITAIRFSYPNFLKIRHACSFEIQNGKSATKTSQEIGNLI
jgi:hypothetical protein